MENENRRFYQNMVGENYAKCENKGKVKLHTSGQPVFKKF